MIVLIKAFASVSEEVSRNATLMVNTLRSVRLHDVMHGFLIRFVPRYHVSGLELRDLSKFPEHDFFGTLYARPQRESPLYAALSSIPAQRCLTLLLVGQRTVHSC